MKWRTLSSKKVFEHPRHSVYIDEVELPSGHKTTYLHFGEAPDAVMVIAINSEAKILLQKEYSYPPDEVMFQLPGGMLDNGESPEAGAVRELAEEANIAGILKPIGWFYLDNRRKRSRMHIFVATNLKEALASKDIEEVFEDHWLTRLQIEELIKSNEIHNYTALAGWALFLNSDYLNLV